jgi:nicotinamidase-related amidase
MMAWSIAALLLLVLAPLVAFGLALIRFTRPSRAGAVAPGSEAALLVIDAQPAYLELLPNGRSDQLLDALRHHIAQARAAGDRVVFVRQVFATWDERLVARVLMGGTGVLGSGGLEVADGLVEAGDIVVSKGRGDAFSSPELRVALAGVATVRFVGLDGAACVQRSAWGALNRGLGVEVVESGVATSYPDLQERAFAGLEAAGARRNRVVPELSR